MKKKISISKILYRLVVIALLFLCVFSLYKICMWKKDNHNNKIINESLHKHIVKKDEKYNINFEALEEKNPDTIGYINVNGTNIDYIVVKGNDNNYYLNHNFNKEKNISGWIFLDYENKLDGTDKNIIIYGHNTADNSMFGTLKDTLDEKWYLNKDNLKIMFITKKGTTYYEVFSNYKIDPEDYYLTKSFNNDEEYLEFIKEIKNRSIYNYNVDVLKDDQILTLSSCANLGKKRVVVHAKRITQE